MASIAQFYNTPATRQTPEYSRGEIDHVAISAGSRPISGSVTSARSGGISLATKNERSALMRRNCPDCLPSRQNTAISITTQRTQAAPVSLNTPLATQHACVNRSDSLLPLFASHEELDMACMFPARKPERYTPVPHNHEYDPQQTTGGAQPAA